MAATVIPALQNIPAYPERKDPQERFDTMIKAAVDGGSTMVSEINTKFIPAFNASVPTLNDFETNKAAYLQVAADVTSVVTCADNMPAITAAPGHASTASAKATEAAGSAAAANTAKVDAQAARADALTAKTGAVSAKDGAVAAKTDAQTAKAGAETARTGAEAARDAAIVAKTDALTAKDNTLTARDDAVAAKADALTAKAGAEAARDVAVAAKTDALTAKAGAEAARDVAVVAKTDAQTAKSGAEAAQAAAEAARDEAGAIANVGLTTTTSPGLAQADGTTVLVDNGVLSAQLRSFTFGRSSSTNQNKYFKLLSYTFTGMFKSPDILLEISSSTAVNVNSSAASLIKAFIQARCENANTKIAYNLTNFFFIFKSSNKTNEYFFVIYKDNIVEVWFKESSPYQAYTATIVTESCGPQVRGQGIWTIEDGTIPYDSLPEGYTVKESVDMLNFVPAYDVAIAGSVNDTAAGRGQIGQSVDTSAVIDLDTYTKAGNFFCSNANANAGANFPVAIGGHLRVTGNAGGTYVVQEYTLHSSIKSYKRIKNGTSWGGWVLIGTATPAANAIPMAGADGKLDAGWIPADVGISMDEVQAIAMLWAEDARTTSAEAIAGNAEAIAGNAEAIAGNAAKIPKTASATLAFGSIAAGALGASTMTVSGAAIGDAVVLSLPNTVAAARFMGEACVSAANTVTVYLHNTTTSAVTPASGVYSVAVIHA